MRTAIVAIEDDRFYEHGALDAKGTARALLRNQAEGGVQQGGSSITQQYVKMSLIEKARTPEEVAAATAETYQRKVAELRYAVAVEKEFSKDEILEKYLNLANFGDGTYGVEAAARHYFNTTAAKLTLPQAAMLAGLVKNPTGYDPTNNAKRAKDRRNVVLDRMLELKVISRHAAQQREEDPGHRPEEGQGRSRTAAPTRRTRSTASTSSPSCWRTRPSARPRRTASTTSRPPASPSGRRSTQGPGRGAEVDRRALEAERRRDRARSRWSSPAPAW